MLVSMFKTERPIRATSVLMHGVPVWQHPEFPGYGMTSAGRIVDLEIQATVIQEVSAVDQCRYVTLRSVAAGGSTVQQRLNTFMVSCLRMSLQPMLG